ncbi:reverse transcriptase domain-containing protein [Tanacetum coccineum]
MNLTPNIGSTASKFGGVKRSKDEVPEFVIKFLKMIQVRLNVIVRNIKTHNGTEFVNQTLKAYYEEGRISHQTSIARTPQQTGVIERQNRTLVEATRTMNSDPGDLVLMFHSVALLSHQICKPNKSCQYHGLLGDDVNKHIDKFLTVTQNMKQNRVMHDILRLCLFPYSLTHHATAWFDQLPKNSIRSWEEMVTKFLSKYFPPSMVTKLRNDISNFRQLPDESLFEAWERYKLSIDRCLNHNMLLVIQIDTFYNGLTLRHRGTINAAANETFMKRRPDECYDLIENMTSHHNDWDTSAQRGESFTVQASEIAAINKNLA